MTYNRLIFSVVGANLKGVEPEQKETCQALSQQFINELIEEKNKKIVDIKKDYENPNILISSEKFKQKCLELEEIYSILGSVGITDDSQTNVVESMKEMRSKISSMTKKKGEDVPDLIGQVLILNTIVLLISWILK